MNQQNLGFLRDSLKYLGFGDGGPLCDQLNEEVSKGLAEFHLYTEACFDENTKLEACLYFRRSAQHDMYFFNKYVALLQYSGHPEKSRSYTFYISKGTGVTFKEAFNLLQGRAVNKDLVNIEGEKYNAWIQLSFDEMDGENGFRMKQYRSQYGFDLEKVLSMYPIRELQLEDTKKALIRSLRRGNAQLVNFVKVNKTEKMFIEANPLYKTINLHPVIVRVADKNSKKPVPPQEEEPYPDPVGPDNEAGAEEEKEVLEESGEVLEPAAAKAPVRKRVYK
jgi:hypothetical protein